MGIPLEIFSLHRLRSDDAKCLHYLLVKVAQAGFNNADEGDYDRAVEAADNMRRRLIEAFEAKMLADGCAGKHLVNLIGELQSYPTGDELRDEYGGFYVDLWIAETRYGHPWVVLGTAENEAAFWREVEQDEELSSLGASLPAKRLRAYFLTEKGCAADKG
jgi:hypothetical protein